MEVLAIQKSALDGMKNELKELLEMTKSATEKYVSIFNEDKWLDNHEVCLILNITKRTLQTYEDKGLLPYSKLSRKNYYSVLLIIFFDLFSFKDMMSIKSCLVSL